MCSEVKQIADSDHKTSHGREIPLYYCFSCLGVDKVQALPKLDTKPDPKPLILETLAGGACKLSELRQRLHKRVGIRAIKREIGVLLNEGAISQHQELYSLAKRKNNAA
jgi:hypothetical protein